MAVREGDKLTTGHGCDAITSLAISLVRTVRANGIVGAVLGSPTVVHLVPPNIPPCQTHASTLKQGSLNVLIGGIPWGRIGDSADAGAMTSGSGDVSVG